MSKRQTRTSKGKGRYVRTESPQGSDDEVVDA
jgi:stalled ribosome alternative rescue factor ArfA